jgi:molybdopterin molybdotransferase
MISANDAYNLIMQNKTQWGNEEVAFQDSVGRILAEDIKADRDFPPFDRVTMDGIGIMEVSTRQKFNVVDIQAAGMPQKELNDVESCLEVMTGAICPKGVTTVIPFENVMIKEGVAEVITPVKQGKNIHSKGFDKKKDDVLIPKGRKISTAEIGIIATVGKVTIKVKKLPRVAILSTGDELVEVNETPKAYQIRKSNVWALNADLAQLGIEASMFHLLDVKEEIRKSLKEILEQFDVVLLSGGVSKGKLDFIPEVMESLEIEKVFHRVKQRPGKPFWFGKYKDEVFFFAFPGNPVSTYSNFHRYFVPWLDLSLEIEKKELFKLKLAGEFNFDLPLTYFLQVKLVQTKNGVQALPIAGKGSGDLANLVETDGFVVIPEEVDHCPIGSEFEYISFRNVSL